MPSGLCFSAPGPSIRGSAENGAVMGFSSFTCAKTNIPVAGTAAAGERVHAEVVVLVEGQDPFRGLHDGYGRVTGSSDSRGVGVVDLQGRATRMLMRAGRAKVVLAAFHEPGDDLASLGTNRPDPAQGVHGSAFLRACHEAGGFRSFEGYELALDRVLPPDRAAGLDRDGARLITSTLNLFREEVAKLRTAGLDAAFPSGKRAFPHYLGIAPSGTGLDAWVAAPDRHSLALWDREVTDAFERACAGVAVPVGAPASVRKGVRAAAAALVDALPPEARTVVPLTRGGEPVGEARTMSCPMSGEWYELRLDGEPALAFHAPADLVRELGLEEGPLRDALWGREGAPAEVDLDPAPAPTR